MMHPPRAIPRSAFIAPHRIIKTVLGALALVIVLGAILWEVLRVTTAPALTLVSPADNFLTNVHSVALMGHAAPSSTVTVNGAPIPLTRDGSFNETLDLRTGLNIITISATKKFAKPRIIYRRVVVSNE